MVGRALAGWDLKTTPHLPTLSVLDDVVLQRIRLVQQILFGSCHALPDDLRFRNEVVDVFMATSIMYFKAMILLAPSSLYVKRVRTAISHVNVSEGEFEAWAMTIHLSFLETGKHTSPNTPAPTSDEVALLRRQSELLEKQAQIINTLASQVTALNDRILRLEVPPQSTVVADGETNVSTTCSSDGPHSIVRVRARPKSLSSVWFGWFSNLLSAKEQNRRRYHECKVVIAFMRIFLPAGHDMTGTSDDAKARILRAGRDAESNILEFLTAENIKARAHGTVVKALKCLDGVGKLDDRILQFRRLQQEGKVLDDSPAKSVHVLSPCGGQHCITEDYNTQSISATSSFVKFITQHPYTSSFCLRGARRRAARRQCLTLPSFYN